MVFNKITVPDVLPRVQAYVLRYPAGGSLHIVLEDQNVKDDHIRFCIGYAEENGDVDGAEIGRLLLQMSKTQRLKVSGRRFG